MLNQSWVGQRLGNSTFTYSETSYAQMCTKIYLMSADLRKTCKSKGNLLGPVYHDNAKGILVVPDRPNITNQIQHKYP